MLDTSVVVEMLRVPFEHDRHDETMAEFDARRTLGVKFQLPVAAIVEAGGHVSRIGNGHHRRECAVRLQNMLDLTLQREAPWTFNEVLWDREFLREVIDPVEDRLLPLAEYLSTKQLEMGDALIVREFRRLRSSLDARAVDVDVWTYDANLRAVVDLLRGDASAAPSR